MNHAMQLQLIEEIQAVFPPELLAGMWLSSVDDRSIDELHARSLTVFSPVYLPIFERHGDLYCVDLVPGQAWHDSAWVQLPHDEADPIIVASRLARLPAGLLTPPHWFPDRVDEVWPLVEQLAEAVSGTTPPVPLARHDFGGEPPVAISLLRAKYDPEDGAAQTGWVLSDRSAPDGDDEILARVEAVLTRMPEDHYVQAVVAIVRGALGRDDAAPLARQALGHEYAWGWSHVGDYNMRRAAAASVLEQLRGIAAPAIDDADPFSICRTISFANAQGAAALDTVAERLRAHGDERGALDQLRNAALLAGVHGQLTAKRCQALAEQTHRVAPGDPAALLAEHATAIIHLGA